jgi:hypothetical protein
MHWEILVALVIAVPVIVAPVASFWYMAKVRRISK